MTRYDRMTRAELLGELRRARRAVTGLSRALRAFCNKRPPPARRAVPYVLTRKAVAELARRKET